MNVTVPSSDLADADLRWASALLTRIARTAADHHRPGRAVVAHRLAVGLAEELDRREGVLEAVRADVEGDDGDEGELIGLFPEPTPEQAPDPGPGAPSDDGPDVPR